MAETIKCVCSSCGAKYRLPVEAQGRTARCKRCGERFQVPKQDSLEDSILSWLGNPRDDGLEDEMPEKPRVITMPNAEDEEKNDDGSTQSRRVRGTIRMKEKPAKEGTG